MHLQAKNNKTNQQTGWYYYGARNSDPAVIPFTTIDPRAEEYYSQSPYAFAANNPVLFVDINGEGVENDYKLDKKTGNISLIKKTNDKSDTLYATDDNGKVDKSKSITVNKRKATDSTIISDLSISNKDRSSSAITGSKNQGKIIELFLFTATNSDVEWSVVRGKQKEKETFGIGTDHNKFHSIAFESMGFELKNMIAEVHSHVSPDSFKDEKGSLYGDRGRYQGYINKLGDYRKMYKYHIYMKQTGNLWSISSYYSKGEYTRNIKGDYRRFFFGTINSK